MKGSAKNSTGKVSRDPIAECLSPPLLLSVYPNKTGNGLSIVTFVTSSTLITPLFSLNLLHTIWPFFGNNLKINKLTYYGNR